MKWRERILCWLAECHGAQAMVAVGILTMEMICAWEPEERWSIVTYMALAGAFILAWQVLLTTAAYGLWKISWRKAFRKLSGAFGRGALLLALTIAALVVLETIEEAVCPLLGLPSIWYWYH